MESTLECKPIKNSRGQRNHVKIQVFVKGNVDLIVAHELKFQQPGPLPLVDNVLTNVLKGSICTGQSKPFEDGVDISRQRMLPCEHRAIQRRDFHWLNTSHQKHVKSMSCTSTECRAQYRHTSERRSRLMQKYLRTYLNRRRKALAVESYSEVLWFRPNLLHDVVEELGLLFLFRQDESTRFSI